jgi:hypothetical protein
MSYHSGVTCYPAMRVDSDERYIVKTISVPASQLQLEALLLTGAYPDAESARAYYKDLTRGIRSEIEILDKLAARRGFLTFLSSQIVPMEEGVGYEIYLLNYFAHSYNEFSTPLFDEAALMCALTLKDIPTFWNCFFRYANSHQTSRMPVHYQEAALLYGNLEKNVDISKMPFDKTLNMRFQDFMRFAQKHAVENVERDPEAKKLFYDRYGNTFWYFYFFIRDVKSY